MSLCMQITMQLLSLSEHATSPAAIMDKVSVHDVGLMQWAAQQLFDNDTVGSSQGLDMIIADFNSEQTAWNLDSRDIPDTKNFTTHHAVPETRIVHHKSSIESKFRTRTQRVMIDWVTCW